MRAPDPFRIALRFAALGLAAGIALGVARLAFAERPFIRTLGTRFLEGDREFFFVGANLNVMHEPTARERAAETIAAAASDGMRVGRIWALGEGLETAPGWSKESYLFRAGPRGWQEATFLHLDRVIAEAGKRGLRLVVTLSNSWSDYGGVPMYLRWAGHVDEEAYGYSDRFFTDPQCREWYREHLTRVIGRTNSVTGVPYRDDPTIMAWELQNEMHGTPEAASQRIRWVAEMARYVRQIDRNHLVVPGVIGYSMQLERQNWIEMNRLPEVAYCNQHAYLEEHLRTRGLPNLRRFIDDRVQLAHHVIGKPVVFGEFGFAKGRRDDWHRRFLERVFFDGGNGAMVWIYQPTLPWARGHSVLIDNPRHRTLRRALEQIARRVTEGKVRSSNTRLGPSFGDKPIAPTHALMTQPYPPSGRWKQEGGRSVLSIAPERFQRAWFEDAGTWDGGILVHAYGRRTGWFEYLFQGAPFVPSRAELRVRLSSEYPGAAGPPDGFSRVMILLDGELVGTQRVVPDDGVGQWCTVRVEDAVLLRRLRGGTHTLRFQVDDGPEANGLAIFGREAELNREPVDDPAPIQIVVER